MREIWIAHAAMVATTFTTFGCAVSSDGPASPNLIDAAGSDSAATDSTDTSLDDLSTADGDDASPTDAGPTWASKCAPTSAPTVSGQIFAPNGKDPAPKGYAYSPISITPFPSGVACDLCDKVIDPFYVNAATDIDGRFTLDLSSVHVTGSTVKIAVRKGRFRKVVELTPTCGAKLAMTASQTSLPGSTTAGDMPKIAVATGNSDHLDVILEALGVTSFSCYEGRATATSGICPAGTSTGKKALDLLKDATTLATYNVLLLSCAPNIWNSYSTADRTTLQTNLGDWVKKGGRLFATDHSYDYVSQTWPASIAWQGPAGPPWTIGTSAGAGANVGVVPAGGSYPAIVDDADMTAWLKLPEIGITSAPSVTVTGWLKSWSVQKSLPTTTKQLSHGSVQFDYPTGGAATTATLPLTSSFVVNDCGKVAYSSYHTLPGVSASGLTPQERILEYLLLDAASCVNGIK